MAILVGGKVLDNLQDLKQTTGTDTTVESTLKTVKRETTVVKSEPRSSESNLDPTKQYVVVNGKPKEIKKHSQYLIDMLTIEE